LLTSQAQYLLKETGTEKQSPAAKVIDERTNLIAIPVDLGAKKQSNTSYRLKANYSCNFTDLLIVQKQANVVFTLTRKLTDLSFSRSEIPNRGYR
jgi:hypothetical protein